MKATKPRAKRRLWQEVMSAAVRRGPSELCPAGLRCNGREGEEVGGRSVPSQLHRDTGMCKCDSAWSSQERLRAVYEGDKPGCQEGGSCMQSIEKTIPVTIQTGGPLEAMMHRSRAYAHTESTESLGQDL
jgi:hypothetical protein